MAQYNEKIGEMQFDNLIASANMRQIRRSVTIAAGQGILKRGTVVALDGNKAKIMASGLTPHGILCDTVDATAEEVAEVYVTGCFNKAALIVAGGYTLTDADIKNLRYGGIYVENIVD